MITFDEQSRIFHLQTPNTSYVFRLKGDYILEHLYYGNRLDDLSGMFPYHYGFFVSGAPNDYDYAGESMYVSTDVMLQEYSFYGSTDLRTPAFHAKYANGSRITKMRYVSHVIYNGKPKLSGLPATYTESDDEAQTLEINMQDDLTGMELIYRYSTYSTMDVITRNVEIRNGGQDAVKLDRTMSCSLDFMDHDFDFIHLYGCWGREGTVERTSLINGNVKIESRRGASSHDHRPFFALARKDATENAGEVYGFSLLYSGSFEMGAEVERYNSTRVYLGISAFDFEWLLNPGETFTTPEVVMVFSPNGLGQMSRTYHKLFRTRLARGKWRDLERPILINNWEATYFNFNEDKLVALAKQAKKAGVEMLVLDDGWFGKRDKDNCSLGDWVADPKKLPGGIKRVAEKINAEGLLFGLWFEPEMISEDSDLYRAHPDWCLHAPGRGRSTGRWQLILDLSRQDVRDYLVESMSAILGNAPVAYVKWDMNRYMSEIGSALLPAERQSEVAHRYMLGLYDFLETLLKKFPDVLFEGCAAGGARFDPGMMYYFNQYWTSDDSDAGQRLFIQHGTSYIMPSIFMGAHVSAVPNHQIGRVTPLNTRGLVAMAGQFGYELDITDYTEEQLAELAAQVEQYKDIRGTIHFGDMYRLRSPFDSNHAVWEYISEDKKTVVVLYFKKLAYPGFERNMLRLEGLCDNATYTLRGTDEVYSGKVLGNYGFCAEKLSNVGKEKMKDFDAKLFVFDMN